jgi:hypothetical protein
MYKFFLRQKESYLIKIVKIFYNGKKEMDKIKLINT